MGVAEWRGFWEYSPETQPTYRKNKKKEKKTGEKLGKLSRENFSIELIVFNQFATDFFSFFQKSS